MDFYEKMSEDTACASCLLNVERYSAEVNLIFTVGRWNHEWKYSFMYICENVQQSWIKVHHTKKDQFHFSSILICYAILSPILLHNCVLFCFNPQYKLVLLLEKYLFLCKYPRGYFVSKCKDTVRKMRIIFKDNNSNIHFIRNYFNRWHTDGKDEYFISLFTSNCSQAEPFECWNCCGFLQNWARSLLTRAETVRHSEPDDGITQPSSTISTKTTV